MIKNLKDIVPEFTSHGCGKKYVFINKENTVTNLTQVAIGELSDKDIIGLHSHPTMEEFYFFLKGNAIFIIGNQTIYCNPDTFVQIPCGVEHKLIIENFVKFIYWGIAK